MQKNCRIAVINLSFNCHKSIIYISPSQERAKESEEAAANARRYAPEETECTIRTNASPDAEAARGEQAGAASAHSGRTTVSNWGLLYEVHIS